MKVGFKSEGLLTEPFLFAKLFEDAGELLIEHGRIIF